MHTLSHPFPEGKMSPKPFKPNDHNSVSAYLVVEDAEKVCAWIERVFDAKLLMRHDRPDGKIAHCELRIDDTVVMLGNSLEGWPAMPANVHVYVPDVHATYRRALEAGGVSIQEPTKKDDPDTRGGVKDPGGNGWWMATHDPEG